MADASTFPPVSDTFLTALKAQFPDKCPGVEVGEPERYARAGEQRLIAWLALQNQLQFHPEPEEPTP